MDAKKAIEKSAEYITNLIEVPGRCSCWPGCARKFVTLELKKLVRRVVGKKVVRR